MMQVQEVNLNTHPLSGISLIEASAGTGKTYTITHLYLRCLLESAVEVQQILVVTFTNAATQELKGRIRDLIYLAWEYLHDHSIQNDQLDSMLGAYREDTQALFRLQKALINFDEAAIYSIHGFCQRVLNIFPVETHSLLQQKIIADERELELAAIKDYWRKHIIGCEIKKLEWILSIWNDPVQLLNDIRPLLGFEQALQQMLSGIKPDLEYDNLQQRWKKIAVSWKNAEPELEELLKESPALKRNMVNPNTVGRLLDAFKNLIDEDVPFRLPDKWELLTVKKLTSCLKKNCMDERLANPFFDATQDFAEQHSAWLQAAKIATLLTGAEFVLEQVGEVKKAAQNISFNDLIAQLSRVLTPRNSSLIQKISGLYPIAMVDEFQDTDNQQYHIFSTLYQHQAEKTLILIGDPKQAIYSFRGADVFTYQQAKRSTAKQFTLTTNFRSTAHYIDLVNRLFSQHKNAFIFNQLIDFLPCKASSNQQKTISQYNKPVAALVSWIHPYTPKPLPKAQATDYFATLCAREIEQILDQKTLQLDGKSVSAEDLTILVKTGRQASLMKNKLAQRGISSALLLRDSVFYTDQAREIALLLEVLINPSNISRLFGLLSTDLYGWNALQIHGLQTDNQALIDLLEQVKVYQQHWQDKGVLSMFFKLLDDQQAVQKNMRHMDGERRITNWLHIVELLQQQSIQHASFSQSLQWLVQQREQAGIQQNEEHQLRLDSDSQLVRIVTIHRSKGLQYPIVFVPFMWDVKGARYQPQSYSVHDDQGGRQLMLLDETARERWHEENLAEEIRLFYVAMTRAIYRCYLGWGHIKGAGSSAIGHTLYSEQVKKGSFPQDLNVCDMGALRLPFVSLGQATQNVDIIEKDSLQPGRRDQQKSIRVTPSARKFSRKIVQQWHISSYSQLASSGLIETGDRPDYDAVLTSQLAHETELETATASKDENELNRFNFQKGARAGNFLHDILEHQAFDKEVDAQLIQQKCEEYGFDEKWIPCLISWMDDILNCDLQGFQLKDLKAEQKLSEMEFYMTGHNVQADALNGLLHQHDYCRPEQSFSFGRLNGFLKGYIDLVFEYKGQYYVADYKSNYLGPLNEHYLPEQCRESMYEHHYHLQYLIYSLALHRYLRQRIPDYDYAHHFGGVYYLFLRGMSATNRRNEGVYFDKPAFDVIRQLDLLFGA